MQDKMLDPFQAEFQKVLSILSLLQLALNLYKKNNYRKYNVQNFAVFLQNRLIKF